MTTTLPIRSQLSLLERARLAKHPLAKRTFHLMHEKQTNLTVAVDVTKQNDLLDLADKLGPSICILKTHIDCIDDYTQDCQFRLKVLAEKHQFLIFEDRKFADIGNTVALQYGGGVHRIADWADLVTVHALPGPGILDALQQVGSPLGRGALLLLEMSSAGNLASTDYAQKSLQIVEDYSSFVAGVITQSTFSDDPGLLHLTPGVKLSKSSDDLGQQYNSPDDVIFHRGSDIAIVGRGITEAADPVIAARKYRVACWQALSRRLTR